MRRAEENGGFKVLRVSFRRQMARLCLARPLPRLSSPSPRAASLVEQQDRPCPSVPFAPRPFSGRSATAAGSSDR